MSPLLEWGDRQTKRQDDSYTVTPARQALEKVDGQYALAEPVAKRSSVGPRCLDIWIINQYDSTPEEQITRGFDFGRRWSRRGHRVTLFAGAFNQYSCTDHDTEGALHTTEERGGVRFVWVRTVPYEQSDWMRGLNMASFAMGTLTAAISQGTRPDVVYASSPHLLAGAAGAVLSRVTGAPFFFEVRDLWPETFVSFGRFSEDSVVVRGLQWIEKGLYRDADRIVTLWPHAGEYLEELGVPHEKIVHVPHGVDMERIDGLPRAKGKHEDTNQFTIMYLGNHSRANALEVVLKAAERLQRGGEQRVRFVFVGDGTAKPRLQQQAERSNLRNVEFRPMVPRREVYSVASQADAFVCGLQDLPLYRYGISTNKLVDYLAMGRPILFAGRPRTNPVEEAGAGITVPPEAPEALANAACELARMSPDERKAMGRAGRAYARRHHDISRLSQRLLDLIESQVRQEPV